MSSISETAPLPPFGVGTIISESFSIFFRKIITIMILGVGPALVGAVLKGGVLGFNVVLEEPERIMQLGALAFIFSTLIDIVVYGLMTAMLVLLAYDVKNGRERSIGEYFRTGLRPIIPVTILSFVVSLIAGIGMIFLIIPGIWIYSVFSVTIPAIVVDKAGFGAMGRSATLTKGYRWPIVGLMIVMFVIMVVLTMLIGVVVAIPTAIGVGIGGGILLSALLSGLGYGIMNISLALIYARLREIKEGVNVDQIASVFD